MKRTHLRSRLFTAVFVVSAAVTWIFFAPTNIGGTTSYVVTHGISMEPLFHSGDLALIRPADHYRVGDIGAYHSTVLHTTVLHRIIALDGNRYVFKGDNNNFIDPTHPSRAQLIGVLWLHLGQGGRVLAWLHTPVMAALGAGAIGLLLLFGAGEKRRRRRRRNLATGGSRQGPSLVHTSAHGVARHIETSALVIVSAAAVAAFLVLALVGFTYSLHKPVTVKVPYTQGVSFGYRTRAPTGPVYPGGVVNTGDPIFIQLVHRVHVQVDYRLATAAAHHIAGTESVLLRLTGPGGWNDAIPLTPSRRFTGDHTSTQATIDLPYLQRLITRVEKLTGFPPGAGYVVSVGPRVHITGTIAGRPVSADYSPVLSFQMNPLQLQPSGAAPGGGALQAGLRPSQQANVATVGTAPNGFSVVGHALPISTLRWIAVIGLLLATASALWLIVKKKLRQPFEEIARIQAKWGHMMVPIASPIDDAWSPFEVGGIQALVRLAECGERLILHHHGDDADTYLVEDGGTMYRYQAHAAGVSWGQWSAELGPVGRAHPDQPGASAPTDGVDGKHVNGALEADPMDNPDDLVGSGAAQPTTVVATRKRSLKAARAGFAKAFLGSRHRPEAP